MVNLTDGSSGGLLEYGFNDYVFVIAAGLLVFSVVGLFSYKLVKSLSDEERKRVEKRKLKVNKKKRLK